MQCDKFEYSNCLFAMFYLYMRGKVDRVVAVSSHSKWWPYHFVSLTKKGHVLHFTHVLPDERNPHAPWWFLGKFEGIRSSRLQQALIDNDRKVCWQFQKPIYGIGLLAAVTLMLAIPWMIAWGLYPLCWTLKWFFATSKIFQRFRRTNKTTSSDGRGG